MLDENLTGQFVTGIFNEITLKRVLTKTDFDMDKAIKIAVCSLKKHIPCVKNYNILLYR